MLDMIGAGKVYTFRQAIDILCEKLKFDHRFELGFDYEIYKADETDDNFIFSIARPGWNAPYIETYKVIKANGEVKRT